MSAACVCCLLTAGADAPSICVLEQLTNSQQRCAPRKAELALARPLGRAA